MERTPRRHGIEALHQEQVQLLDDIDFIWDGADFTRKRAQEQWLAKFHDLDEYKRKHGNFSQLKKHAPQLHRWIRREIGRLAGEREETSMGKERIDLLESKGYRLSMFDEADENIPQKDQWMLNFNKMKRYKEAQGDCFVNVKHKELGKWVVSQRKQYKLRRQGKRSQMTDEQVQLLNEDTV